MPVEFAVVKRAPVAEQILVVGNLIGAATVQVVPRVNGRLATVNVKLGDSVRARADHRQGRGSGRSRSRCGRRKRPSRSPRRRSASATPTSSSPRPTSIGRRASTSGSCCRSRPTTTPRRRYQAALAQIDLAHAQFEQAKARLDELKITLSNTIIASPVDGFVGKRFSIPARSSARTRPVPPSSTSAPCAWSRTWSRGTSKRVPSAPRRGRSRCVPGREVPGTRQPRRAGLRSGDAHRGDGDRDPQQRLPPQARHVFARVADGRFAANALTVPRNALVELDGKTGVFIAASGPSRARVRRQDPPTAARRGVAGGRAPPP